MRTKAVPADWCTFAWIFGLLARGYWLTPALLYAEKPQPFQFSHELHMKQVADGCQSCHVLRKDGSFSGIPGNEVCLDCHGDKPLGKTPEEAVFVRDYLAKDRPVPWRVYAKQPECVFFSHAAHLESAGLECAKCHGDHGQSKKLRSYGENRLTGYPRDVEGRSIFPFLNQPPQSMKMGDCANCHRDNGVRDACFVCHK